MDSIKVGVKAALPFIATTPQEVLSLTSTEGYFSPISLTSILQVIIIYSFAFFREVLLSVFLNSFRFISLFYFYPYEISGLCIFCFTVYRASRALGFGQKRAIKLGFPFKDGRFFKQQLHKQMRDAMLAQQTHSSSVLTSSSSSTVVESSGSDPIGDPHQFYHQEVGFFRRPAYCNVCTRIMTGTLDEALCCDICGYNTHASCVSFVKNDCKAISTNSLAFSTIYRSRFKRSSSADLHPPSLPSSSSMLSSLSSSSSSPSPSSTLSNHGLLPPSSFSSPEITLNTDTSTASTLDFAVSTILSRHSSHSTSTSRISTVPDSRHSGSPASSTIPPPTTNNTETLLADLSPFIPPLSSSPALQSILRKLESQKTPHQLARGNHSTVTDLCIVCAGVVGSFISPTGLHCMWCGFNVHESCLPTLLTSHRSIRLCSFGALKELILQPQCVYPGPGHTSSSVRLALRAAKAEAESRGEKLGAVCPATVIGLPVSMKSTTLPIDENENGDGLVDSTGTNSSQSYLYSPGFTKDTTNMNMESDQQSALLESERERRKKEMMKRKELLQRTISRTDEVPWDEKISQVPSKPYREPLSLLDQETDSEREYGHDGEHLSRSKIHIIDSLCDACCEAKKDTNIPKDMVREIQKDDLQDISTTGHSNSNSIHPNIKVNTEKHTNPVSHARYLCGHPAPFHESTSDVDIDHSSTHLSGSLLPPLLESNTGVSSPHATRLPTSDSNIGSSLGLSLQTDVSSSTGLFNDSISPHHSRSLYLSPIALASPMPGVEDKGRKEGKEGINASIPFLSLEPGRRNDIQNEKNHSDGQILRPQLPHSASRSLLLNMGQQEDDENVLENMMKNNTLYSDSDMNEGEGESESESESESEDNEGDEGDDESGDEGQDREDYEDEDEHLEAFENRNDYNTVVYSTDGLGDKKARDSENSSHPSTNTHGSFSTDFADLANLKQSKESRLNGPSSSFSFPHSLSPRNDTARKTLKSTHGSPILRRDLTTNETQNTTNGDITSTTNTLSQSSSTGPVAIPHPIYHPLWEFRIPEDSTPLLVFINRRSGGNKGTTLMHEFLELLNPLQVWDLSEFSPITALSLFSHVPRLQILVCGGDGTVAWVLSSLDEVAPPSRPPIAIMPLGTGNDLSQVLGWGARCPPSVRGVLLSILRSNVAILDRWNAVVKATPGQEHTELDPAHADKALLAQGKTRLLPRSPREGFFDQLGDYIRTMFIFCFRFFSIFSLGNYGLGWIRNVNLSPHPQGIAPLTTIVNNYIGFGLDATVTHKFHLAREAHPWLFFSQVLNKIWYIVLGSEDYFAGHARNVLRDSEVQVFVDGEEIDISGVQGVCLLNIKSFGGGINVWGSDDPNDDDGDDDDDDSNESGDDESDSNIDDNDENKNDKSRQREILSRQKEVKVPEHGSTETPSTNVPATSTSARKLLDPRIDDELVEVIGIRDSLQVGLMNFGLARGVRLAQGRKVVVRTKGPLPVQVDGEPWGVRESCDIELTLRCQSLMLAPNREIPTGIARILRDLKGIVTGFTPHSQAEMTGKAPLMHELVDVIAWSMRKGVIDPEQGEMIIREFSKRHAKAMLEPRFYGDNTNSSGSLTSANTSSKESMNGSGSLK